MSTKPDWVKQIQDLLLQLDNCEYFIRYLGNVSGHLEAVEVQTMDNPSLGFIVYYPHAEINSAYAVFTWELIAFSMLAPTYGNTYDAVVQLLKTTN